MTVLRRVTGIDRLPLFATALAAAGGLVCAGPEATRTVPPRPSKDIGSPVYNASRRNAGGIEAKVNLLARAFLPSSGEAHAGFAYYAYLLFTDSSPTSAPARRAASATFLSMLAHVYPAGGKTGIRREEMAVLYVPLGDKTAPGSLTRDRDPQSLLAAYDYVRARGIANSLKRAGKTVPDVAIVGCTRPLAGRLATASETVDVVDLSDPGTAGERIERFRDSLESGERHVREGGQPIVLKSLRDFFAWAEAAASEGSSVLTF